MKNKETIIIQHGHLYLFFTMGIYYTWELAKKYKIVLIVNDDYKFSKRFKVFCETLKINHVIFFLNIKLVLLEHIINIKAILEKLF